MKTRVLDEARAELRDAVRWYEERSSGLFNFCGWAYDTGSGAVPSLGASHTYYKVRTATQATGFIFKQRVEGGVGHGPGPC